MPQADDQHAASVTILEDGSVLLWKEGGEEVRLSGGSIVFCPMPAAKCESIPVASEILDQAMRIMMGRMGVPVSLYRAEDAADEPIIVE